MRHIAIHDQKGSISALIACPPDGPPMTVALGPGQQTTEVDLAESGLDILAVETEEAAREALATFRVDMRRESRVVRRSSGQAT
jgi:hypothetical protein